MSFYLYGIPLVLVSACTWDQLVVPFPQNNNENESKHKSHSARRQNFSSCLQKTVSKNQDELHRKVIIKMMTILYHDHDHHCVCVHVVVEKVVVKGTRNTVITLIIKNVHCLLPNRFSTHSYTYIDTYTLLIKVSCE